MSLTEDAENYDELARLKRELNNVQRQLYETKHRRADYLSTVDNAVRETILGQTIEPVPMPDPYTYAASHCYTVALLSDTQTGKITPDYNSNVARARVLDYADKIIELGQSTGTLRCAVPMLGDMIEGVDIFPGQQWLIDTTLYRQVFDTTPVMVVEFLRRLLTWFEHVEVYAVQGNHGRIGRKGQFGPEDNADKMVYRIVQLMLRDEPRVSFSITDYEGERSWYQIMHLGAYSALLIHGDQIRGQMGFPWYGLGKKVHSWASGGLPGGDTFTDVMMGHYHQMAAVPLNHRTVWANGSTESTNTFAAETLAAQSTPGQWVLTVDPETGGVNSAHPVRLA